MFEITIYLNETKEQPFLLICYKATFTLVTFVMNIKLNGSLGRHDIVRLINWINENILQLRDFLHTCSSSSFVCIVLNYGLSTTNKTSFIGEIKFLSKLCFKSCDIFILDVIDIVCNTNINITKLWFKHLGYCNCFHLK